jgi:CubicO group peptidase (beta-lactamase class C family)
VVIALAGCVISRGVAEEARDVAEAEARQDLQHLLETTLKKNEGYSGVFRVATPGRVIFEGAAGLTALAGSPPLTTDTLFEMSSITKTMWLDLVQSAAKSIARP